MELSKVASGGELSRLMLAIKFISSKYSNLDTLIFDEIDSGVSGEIASLMGEMMKKMGESTQVLAISHLPQIASKGERHLKVIKTVVNSETISNIITLNNNERVEEIAKLLSGKRITEAAFDNATIVDMAMGGSTNAMIHLIAIAGRAGIKLDLERFDKISKKTPVLANIKPSGEFLIEDF